MNTAETLAAGRIIDVMTGGEFDWRARLEDSDFLESGDWLTALAYARAASPPPDAGEVRTYREGVEMACRAFDQAIADGYQGPQHEDHQCKHGAVSDSDCIACYDNALTASIAAIRKLP